MLTLLIQINGVTIDRIDVVNRGRVSGDIDRHLYEWQTPGANGYVTHHRDDGAAVLIQRVIAELLAQQTIDATNTPRPAPPATPIDPDDTSPEAIERQMREAGTSYIDQELRRAFPGDDTICDGGPPWNG